MKHISVTLTLLLALLFLGCSSDKEQLQVENDLSTSSQERVDLQASGAQAYSWRQISGTPVILINANTATPSFIAPDVVTQETLVFELEAVSAEIQGENITLKKQVQVTVHPKAVTVESTDMDSTPPDAEPEQEPQEEIAEAGATHMHSTSGEVERVKDICEHFHIRIEVTIYPGTYGVSIIPKNTNIIRIKQTLT